MRGRGEGRGGEGKRWGEDNINGSECEWGIECRVIPSTLNEGEKEVRGMGGRVRGRMKKRFDGKSLRRVRGKSENEECKGKWGEKWGEKWGVRVEE